MVECEISAKGRRCSPRRHCLAFEKLVARELPFPLVSANFFISWSHPFFLLAPGLVDQCILDCPSHVVVGTVPVCPRPMPSTKYFYSPFIYSLNQQLTKTYCVCVPGTVQTSVNKAHICGRRQNRNNKHSKEVNSTARWELQSAVGRRMTDSGRTGGIRIMEERRAY